MRVCTQEWNHANLLLPKHLKSRVWEVDFLRGLCIILVVFDHTMLDFWMLPGMANNWGEVGNRFFEVIANYAAQYWYAGFRTTFRIVVISVFVFTSGISCTFTRSNAGRFFKMAAAASLITLATVFAKMVLNMNVIILFGILHMMTLNILVYIVAKKLFRHWSLYIILATALTAGGILIGFWRFPSVQPYLSELDNTGIYWPLVVISFALILYGIAQKVAKVLDKTRKQSLLRIKKRANLIAYAGALVVFLLVVTILIASGLPLEPIQPGQASAFMKLVAGTGIFGNDYYGILPYTGIFLFGAAAGELLYPKKESLLPKLDGNWNRYFVFAGRNTLWIYLAHQILVLSGIVLIAMLAGYSFS